MNKVLRFLIVCVLCFGIALAIGLLISSIAH